MKIKNLLKVCLFLFVTNFSISQSISSELVDYEILKAPKFQTNEDQRNFKVKVTSPYNLTTEDVINQSKTDFQNTLNNYENVVKNSEIEYQKKLKDYDSEVVKAKEKFELESTEFKKLSMIERLSMTDQGRNPKLVTPSRPEYYKPTKPVYSEPNLNDYIILNNDVLATQIRLDGFTKGGNNVDIAIDISKINFQDNAGQTYVNQPTTLIVKVNGVEKINSKFFTEYDFISSSPSNNINKPLTEKNHLNKVVAFLNSYLNDNFGYQSIKNKIQILSVKNKNAKYDDLEKADIYIKTNLRKLNPQNPEMTQSALTNMQKGIDIWKATLTKVNFKDKKADFNSKIAEFVYFNLIRLNLVLNNKVEAEKFLNEMQENMIYMDLSYDDQNALKKIESEIYKKK